MSPVEKKAQVPEDNRLPGYVWAGAAAVAFNVAPEVVKAALSHEDIPDEVTREEVFKALEAYKNAPANRG